MITLTEKEILQAETWAKKLYPSLKLSLIRKRRNNSYLFYNEEEKAIFRIGLMNELTKEYSSHEVFSSVAPLILENSVMGFENIMGYGEELLSGEIYGTLSRVGRLGRPMRLSKESFAMILNIITQTIKISMESKQDGSANLLDELHVNTLKCIYLNLCSLRTKVFAPCAHHYVA